MNKRSDPVITFVLFVFVFIIEFWISIDSYTHDLFNRIDSAWFFMGGKAWMNGMIPYVDFSDSKGPLLWLIYGIGYLLSNYDYIGIFWIGCIFYTVTFFYCYKIGCLFLTNKKIALLCSMFMALSFFCGTYHYETRAEDFCQPFITGGLYYILRVLYESQNDRNIKIASFAAGIGFAATLLIKYTIAAMILIFFFVLFCYLIKCRKNLIWKSFMYSLAGILLVLLPFVAYFLYQGNFGDFINEYFVATSQTVVKEPTLKGMIRDYLVEGWGSLFHLNILKSFTICFLLLNIAVGCTFFYKKLSVFKWVPAIIAGWFICISMYHALGYYYQAFSVFAIFPIAMYNSFINPAKLKKIHIVFFAGVIAVIVFVGNLTFTRPNFFLTESKERKDFYYVSQILSQVPNPKIMYSFYDTGYGTPAHALPGCKYYTEQLGSLDYMLLERELVIEQGHPDFVIVLSLFDTGNRFTQLLQQSGYVEYYTWTTQEATHFYETHLYGKPGLLIPKNP